MTTTHLPVNVLDAKPGLLKDSVLTSIIKNVMAYKTSLRLIFTGITGLFTKKKITL